MLLLPLAWMLFPGVAGRTRQQAACNSPSNCGPHVRVLSTPRLPGPSSKRGRGCLTPRSGVRPVGLKRGARTQPGPETCRGRGENDADPALASGDSLSYARSHHLQAGMEELWERGQYHGQDTDSAIPRNYL